MRLQVEIRGNFISHPDSKHRSVLPGALVAPQVSIVTKVILVAAAVGQRREVRESVDRLLPRAGRAHGLTTMC